MNRLFGIGLVWVGCCIAWVVLGSTLLVRSDDSTLTGSSDVHALWGPPTEQRQPTASYPVTEAVDDTRTETDAEGHTRTVTNQRMETRPQPIPLMSTNVEVELALEHRRRGLQWYPTYAVDLDGRYTFVNDSDAPQTVTVEYPLSSGMTSSSSSWSGRGYAGGTGQSSVFDGFVVHDEAGTTVPFEIAAEHARWTVEMQPGERRTFQVGYRSRGTQRWQYRLADGTTRVTDFSLTVQTDFDDVDFPDGTLSPTQHGPEGDGWRGSWQFESSIASRPIGIEMPQRLNPGPLAARITFFAPVGLLFFFFVVGILARARKKDLHPMHYFFLGCSFFAFHLLFAYLVDHLSIGVSFAAAAAVSVALVVSYARLFTGLRFALIHIGISQLLYLVLFSYTFMWEGFTGLAITIGAVLTLFVMMQITGRTKWGKAKATTPEAPPVPNPAPPAEGAVLDARPKTF